jgi:nucleoprotein TPR
LERQNNTETETLSKLQSELRLSSIMNRDLSRQIQYMLQINEDLRNGVSLDISLQFFKNINAVESNEIDISDTDIVISERLTTFRNIEELHQQNQNLLRVVRQLGDRMEKEEKEHQTRMENLESSAILNATQMIDELQAELRSVRIQREGLLRENDILKGSSIRQPTPHEDKTPSPQNNKCTTPPIHINQDNLRVLEKNFEIYRRETSADMQELNEEIKKLSEEKTQTQIIANKFQAQLEFTEERHALLLASNSAFRELN